MGIIAPPAASTFYQARGLVADAVVVNGPITLSYAYCTSGSIAGSVLTVTGSQNAGTQGGAFAVGQTVYVNGVSTGATIVSLGTGTGGSGTYNLSGSPGDVSGVAISASSTTLVLTNAAFTAADVGKGIRLQGGGTNGTDLVTTIAAVTNATTIVLAAPPVSVPFNGRGGSWFASISYGTDNSTALKTAHDAAVAAGQRYVWVKPGAYWCGNLLYAGNVSFIGEGASFVGTTLFRVFHPFKRAAYTTRPSIDPALHLATFKATSNPRVAFIGDSIGTPNSIGNSGVYIAQEIKKELLRRYPTKGLSFFNFSIGGCAMSDLASGSEINFAGRGLSTPYWHTAGRTWLQDVQNTAWGAAAPPHLVVIELGTNVITTVGAELAALYSAIAQIKAFSTTPDIILLTPGVGSLQNASWYGAGGQKEGIGAFWRGYCLRNGLGFIDVGRHARLLRDGVDVLNNDIPQVALTNFTSSRNLPITLPPCRDYMFQFNMVASTVTSNITTGNQLNFTIGDTQSPGYPTRFQVGATAGGNFAVSLFQLGYGTVFGPVDTGVAIPTSGTVYFEFSVRDNYVRFAAANTNYGAGGIMPSAWEGHVERVGGLFNPAIFLQNYVSTNLFPTQLCVSAEQTVLPALTDQDLFGPQPSGTIHPTSTGQTQMYRAALESERFY
jgi:hypothetical protein